jgi:hypothetical protein
MRYRELSASGDYTFGVNGTNFLINSPEAVAQAVKTRLGISTGEWFLDLSYGTPYQSRILGAGRVATYDSAIQQVILDTPGVTAIIQYNSSVNPNTRAASVFVVIETQYGQATINTSL